MKPLTSTEDSFSNMTRLSPILIGKPCPAHGMLSCDCSAGQALAEYRMGLKTVLDVGRVSEGPNSGRGKGQGRLQETLARWKNMQRTLELSL